MNESTRPVSEVPSPALLDRPTSVRWRIVALLMALSFASWFLRLSMPAAYNERIEAEWGISEEAIGTVYSALLLSYMLCMTPGGWCIDRFGPRTALLVMCLGLAAFTALTGLVGPVVRWFAVADGVSPAAEAAVLALPLFLVIRSLTGIFATPMYPASARVISHWLPFRTQGWANGLVQGAACVGMASTPLAFGAMIDGFKDWPQAFLISAAVVALLGLAWHVWAADSPNLHPAVNAAERQLIQAETAPLPARATPGKQAGKWLVLLRNRSLLFLTASYAAVGYFEYLFFFWMDHYFQKQLELPNQQRRSYSAIVLLATAVGMALGGWLSDRLVQAYGYRWGRALVPVGGMLASGGMLCLGLQATEPIWIVVCFSLALGAVGATEGPFWMTAVELGSGRGGTAAGILNTGGNAGGLLAPVVTPWVAKRFGWPLAISLASAVCLIGAMLWLWIDPRERVEEPTS
jgi:MFS family permease